MKTVNQRTPKTGSRFLEVPGLWDAWTAIGRQVVPLHPEIMNDPSIYRYRVAGLIQDEEQGWWVALMAKEYRSEEAVPLSTFTHLFQEVQA